MSYVVTGALVNLRVPDTTGQYVLQGFYAGGVLPDDVHPDDLDRHVRKGMVAEQGTEQADAATPYGKPVQFDEGGMPMSDAAVAARQPRTPAKSTEPAKPKAEPAKPKG